MNDKYQIQNQNQNQNLSWIRFSIYGLIILFLFVIFALLLHSIYEPPIHTKEMLSYIPPAKSLPLYSTKQLEQNLRPEDILVFMVATPEIRQYASLSIELNETYCKRYGFEFEVVQTNLNPELPINFTKIVKTLQCMKLKSKSKSKLKSKYKYKYIMHIDADAVIYNQDYDLRNIIYHYLYNGSSIHFIAGEDCYDKKICSKPNRMNSGVYIVKNSFIGQQIMNTWLTSVLPGGACVHLKNKFPNCQLVFQQCVRPRYFLAIQIVPYNILNGVDGLFIQHYMQNLDTNRTKKMREWRNLIHGDKLTSEYALGRKRLSVY